MNITVYSVIVTYVDDIMQPDLDDIYPTEDSAIKAAKKIGRQRNCYQVQVNEDLLTEEYGRRWKRTVYEEKHEENYYKHYEL